MRELPLLVHHILALLHHQPLSVVDALAAQTLTGRRMEDCTVREQLPVLVTFVAVALGQLDASFTEHLDAEVLLAQLALGAQREVLGHGDVRVARVQTQRSHVVFRQL